MQTPTTANTAYGCTSFTWVISNGYVALQPRLLGDLQLRVWKLTHSILRDTASATLRIAVMRSGIRTINSRAQRARLVLHFDVNKTILMVDPASGLSALDVATDLVAASAWGTVQGDTWTALDVPLSVDPPAPGAHTFADFAKNILHHGYTLDAAENRRRKCETRRVQQSFCDEGAPGARFVKLRDLIHESLRANVMPTAAPSGDAAATAGISLVPSYFVLLDELLSAKRNVQMIFRTFGGDLDHVVAEHNAWCTRAEHAGAADLVIREFGTFSRTGPHSNNVELTAVSPDSSGGGVTHVHGIRAIHDFLELDPRRCWALTDDYRSWWESHEASSGGKLMPFDPSDADVHHIFLDDNIGASTDAVRRLPAAVAEAFARTGVLVERESRASRGEWAGPDRDAKIVDPQCVATGTALSYSQLRNIHLVRVDPLSAIFSPSYFVGLVEMCETARYGRGP